MENKTTRHGINDDDTDFLPSDSTVVEPFAKEQETHRLQRTERLNRWAQAVVAGSGAYLEIAKKCHPPAGYSDEEAKAALSMAIDRLLFADRHDAVVSGPCGRLAHRLAFLAYCALGSVAFFALVCLIAAVVRAQP